MVWYEGLDEFVEFKLESQSPKTSTSDTGKQHEEKKKLMQEEKIHVRVILPEEEQSPEVAVADADADEQTATEADRQQEGDLEANYEFALNRENDHEHGEEPTIEHVDQPFSDLEVRPDHLERINYHSPYQSNSNSQFLAHQVFICFACMVTTLRSDPNYVLERLL